VPDSPTLDDDSPSDTPRMDPSDGRAPASAGPRAPRERTIAGMPVRLLVVGTAVALIAAVAAGAIVALSQDDGAGDEATISLQDDAALDAPDQAVVGAPVAVPYTTFDGEPRNTGQLVGRPVVLNFFAEWCGPCLREMPDFELVHQERGDEVAFLGLSIDRVAADGLAIAESTGITYDVGRDADSGAWDLFGGTGMPTTVLIDATGAVRLIHSGELTADELRAAIDEHLG
jgi:cytochrome c biogenesis protein CcmG, thiol:disulfide interchange protein DsbE